MSTHLSEDNLMRIADDELAGPELSAATAHIANCAACERRLRLIKTNDAAFAESLGDVGISEGIAEAVRKKIVAERKTRFVPRWSYGLAAAGVIALICGYALLDGPVKQMFQSTVDTETMGRNQAALTTGIYGGAEEQTAQIDDGKAIEAPDASALRYSSTSALPSKVPVQAPEEISSPEPASPQPGALPPASSANPPYSPPASPVPQRSDATTIGRLFQKDGGMAEAPGRARSTEMAMARRGAVNGSVAPSTFSMNEVKFDLAAELTNDIAGYAAIDGIRPSTQELEQRSRESDFNTEEYDGIVENEYQDVTVHPVSTFSIDVDRASYSNARRFLTSNQMPPKSAVRIEEMINYFKYDYPEPSGDAPFSINTEIARCPWNAEHLLLHVGLQGKAVATENLPPSNIVFLIDVSGSMQSPDKLALLKASFRLLVERLREIDRVAIVVYAGSSGLVLPSTPGSNKTAILEAIDRLEAGGSTAGAEGIQLAYKVAEENFQKNANNRVILATDGDFNVGVSSDGELVELIERKRESGVFLTVLGFGTGNLKDSRMEKLADKGNGNYAYIDSIREGQKIFVHELGGTLFTIAKDVKIQIEFNPTNIKAYRLVGYENRKLAREDFDDDKKDAGELGSGHTVTALYEIMPAGSNESLAGVTPLKYQEEGKAADAKYPEEMLTLRLRYKKPDGDKSLLLSRTVARGDISVDKTSNNFDFSAAVAEFGLLLRDSRFKGTATYDHALRMARGSKGADMEGYRAEFIGLVETAKLLQ